jgi:hypothetical protein
MTTWLNIEEAKKDGTLYLLQSAEGYVSLGSWKQDYNIGEFDDDDEFQGERGWFSDDGDSWSMGYYFTPLTPVKFLDFTKVVGYDG